MDLRLIAATLVLVAGGEWDPVWDALEQRAGVEAIRGLVPESDDALRRALVDAWLEPESDAPARLAGRVDALAPGTAWPLDDRETWLAAGAVPPGPVRGRVVVRALEGAGADSPAGWKLQLAYEAGVQAAEDQRLAEALAIQRPLHAIARAEWSAMNLALSLRRLGDYAGADAVLGRQMDAGEGSAELLSQRGLNALAGGDRDRARDWLVRALARGSSDAAVILGRVELAAGRVEAARDTLRPLLAAETPGAWALRGWGLALAETPLTTVRAEGR